MAICVFLVTLVFSVKSQPRFLAAYGLSAVGLFGIGLILFWLDATAFQKYYWFRVPDVMIPFLLVLIPNLWVNEVSFGRAPIRKVNWSWLPQVGEFFTRNRYISHLILILLVGIAGWQIWNSARAAPQIEANRRFTPPPMMTWIAANTPEDAVFMTDAWLMEFYVHAQRAMFVSYKHVPQQDQDLLAWYDRIMLTNGHDVPRQTIPLTKAEWRANFYSLPAATIQKLAADYGVDYYLGKPGQNLPFPVIQQTTGWVLYEIPGK